jgi:serine-type D-Ala-D-Ala endopeptidase (penicillin-binding protein 7)
MSVSLRWRSGWAWLLAVCVGLAGLGVAGVAEAQTSRSIKTAPHKADAGKPAKPAKAAKAGVRGKSGAAARPGKVSQRAKARAKRAAPPRPSVGQLSGLHAADDALALRSSVALVVDQETDEVLFSKNPDAVLPIASITKLMTALVVTEAQLPLDEVLEVSRDDVAATSASNARSRLAVGTQLTRGEALHLALMASENRAAHILGRTYPGGMDSFVEAMNGKAQLLGMQDTRYVEPTGLSASNRSSASDLTRLVRAAFSHPIIRDLSTSLEAAVPVGRRTVQFRNTNGLVRHPEWEIGLQKTGYISAAGRCVVMQTQMAGRKLIMVLLDSAGRYSRIGDAERIRSWLGRSGLLPTAAEEAPDLPPILQAPR